MLRESSFVLVAIYLSFTRVFGNRQIYRTTSAPVGGLFNTETLDSSLQAFRKIAPHESEGKTYYGRYLDSNVEDTYSASIEVCNFTSNEHGVVALVDPRPTYGICDIVCLLCNKYNIPHLSIGWEPIDSLEENRFTLSYYPPLDVISKAYTQLRILLNFDKLSVLYEDEGSFIRLQDVINSWPNIKNPILFRKLDPHGDNREIFKNIISVEQMNYHILDCAVENTIKYFTEITQIDDSTQYQSFILTNLDAYTVNLSEIPELMANVSTLHLTTRNEDKWRDIGLSTISPILLETALTADAMHHVERAIKSMLKTLGKDKLEEPPAICYDSSFQYDQNVWPLGESLREAMFQVKANGTTGNIEFDKDGRRTNFRLNYSKLNQHSEFVYVGKWDSNTNEIIEENYVSDRSSGESSSILRVTTKKGEPFIYVIETENGPELEGYAVDLIVEIFNIIKKEKGIDIKYEIKRVPGDEYGRPVNGTKKWNGMIGQLIEHKADLAVCDLTITSERNAVVDFSIPFMTLGISMLMKEEKEREPQMFSFFLPLSLDVWLYLATTYIIVSFILLICARMCQEDWVNPHPCNQNPENLENIWSFYNCMWLTMGSIMCQGCDILPRAGGSRWISGMWWFFALIVTSSYTANMSTFLRDNRRNNDINSAKDLLDQNTISYGAVTNASTYTFFQNSDDPVYQKLWSVMNAARPSVFAKDNIEGMNRVLKSEGKYAFFMESTAIEYYTKRNCDLKMVGDNLDSKEYGIAFPKNSPYKEAVDYAILSLQESGRLEELEKKWWDEKHNNNTCKRAQKPKEDDGSLQMKNTSGIFLVLGVGGILGLLVAVIDFLMDARQISVKEKVSFREAVLSEWRASLNPKTLQKMAAPSRSAPSSTASPSPRRERSQSRAVSVLRAASSFINFDEIY